jgi:hypothetical protein
MLFLTERKRATVTGTLFILATLSSLVGSGVTGSSLHAPDYLAAISRDHSRVALSAMFQLVAAVFYLVAVLCFLALVPLSREYARAGAASAPQFQVTGSMMLAVGEWAGFEPGAERHGPPRSRFGLVSPARID